MLLMLHDKKEITVQGEHTHGNCKPVFDMTTGEIYASSLDAAEAIGVYQASLSNHLAGRIQSIKGKKFCFVSDMTDHIDEVSESIREKQETIDSLRETIRILNEANLAQARIIAEYEAREKAREELKARKAAYEAKRQALEEEARLIEELEKGGF